MAAVVEAVENIFRDVGDAVGNAVESVSDAVSQVAQEVGQVVGDAAQAIGKAGVELDTTVNREIPGGWITVGAVAATVATAGMLSAGTLAAEGAGAVGTAEGVAAAEAATSFAGGDFAIAAAESSPNWWAGMPDWSSVVNASQKVATAAGTGALKGAGVGAATSLIAGKDPMQGAITGAKFGALTGGAGEFAKAAELGSVGTKLLQTAAPSLITGVDPTKNLMNTAMSLGAGAAGGEFGLDNQTSQTALSVGKALTAGGDPTKKLLGSLINAGVGATTKTFSDVFKDAVDNGMTPEQAYTVASGTEGIDTSAVSPTDTGGISGSTTDAEGNTVYNYNDGSVLTVSADGEVIDATEATQYEDVYDDPEQTAYEDTTSTDPYVDPQTEEPVAQIEEPVAQGGLPSDPNASSTGNSNIDKALSSAADKSTSMVQSQLNKGLTSAVSNAIMPVAAKPAPKPKPPVRKPVVSKAQTAKTTYKPITPGVPVSTLPATQAAANQILSGAAPTQATTGVMTPEERMAAIAAAFGGAAPVSKAPTPLGFQMPGFAAGGTIDYTQEFIDQSTPTKYMRPGVSRGRADYTLPPGYPFGQLWRIGMAEGGGVEGHNPQFFSEGGLNTLENTYVKGNGDGTSDSIPAMLANGEFVIPADVVSGLGNGSNDSGAKVLDEFLKIIRKHKQKTGADKLPPDSKGPLGYLLEANKKVKK